MFVCEICTKSFNNADSLRQHKYRSRKQTLSCKQKEVKRKHIEIISHIEPKDLIEAVENKEKNKKNEESLDELKQMVNTLLEENKSQKQQNALNMEKLSKQNEELKEMMVDMQSNPRLLMICNTLCPLEHLNLRDPRFKPVLEILDKELPEYANLGNDKTGRVHAKAVKTLNSIQPTAVEEEGNIFYKSENVLSKDTSHTTTRAFIDAFGSVGYGYAKKAKNDLESSRESDKLFQKEVLHNAEQNAIPRWDEITEFTEQ